MRNFARPRLVICATIIAVLAVVGVAWSMTTPSKSKSKAGARQLAALKAATDSKRPPALPSKAALNRMVASTENPRAVYPHAVAYKDVPNHIPAQGVQLNDYQVVLLPFSAKHAVPSSVAIRAAGPHSAGLGVSVVKADAVIPNSDFLGTNKPLPVEIVILARRTPVNVSENPNFRVLARDNCVIVNARTGKYMAAFYTR